MCHTLKHRHHIGIDILNNVMGLWLQYWFSFNLIENLFLNKDSEPTIRFFWIPEDDKGKEKYLKYIEKF